MELAAHCLKEPIARSWIDHRGSVRPIRGHGVVRIGDCDDLRDHWDIGADDPIRVTMAVNALVMMTDDCGDIVICCDLPQDPLAYR